MSTVATAAGRIGWHELLTRDIDAAKAFYGQLLGWQTEVFQPGGFDYQMIQSGGQGHGGYLPLDQFAPQAPPHWIAYVTVEDIDQVASKTKAGGGTIVFGPSEIPEIGRILVLLDPAGAAIAAIQPATGGGDGMPMPEGVFVWDELATTDVEAAKEFYGDLFGWNAETMDMEGMPYTIFQRGDRQIAGAMTKMAEDPSPPHWTTYIHADDIDATTAKVSDLGGTVLVEPSDIPGVGRFSLIQDPTGAVVGLYRSSS
jgi:predicted enzyme related to lactoylglutathione lyase